MILRAMMIGFVIGIGLGFYFGMAFIDILGLGVFVAIIAIPVRKWLLRTFWM